jgi:hypothetical protein
MLVVGRSGSTVVVFSLLTERHGQAGAERSLQLGQVTRASILPLNGRGAGC